MASVVRNTARALFMTPEESERVRQTVQTRLQRCRDLAGQPRQSNPKRNLIATASFLADISGGEDNSEDAVPAYAVGEVWPPCCESLERLSPIAISELCFGTRHAGRVLYVQRASPVVKSKVVSWAAGEEKGLGEVERLETVLFRNGVGGKDLLELGEEFAVKEPLLTIGETGEIAIRVTQPSDLVVMSWNDGECEARSQATAAQCKDRGNAALKAKDLCAAYARYSAGLHLAAGNEDETVRQDLHRNRAHVNLLLGHYDEALTDGFAALAGLHNQRSKDLAAKAYFRAACAAYNLSDFEEAQRSHEKQQALAPGDQSAVTGIQKCQQRLRERLTGEYDWPRLQASLSKSRPRVDVASFLRNTSVLESPGRGRGLFATRDLRPGDLVLAEKAFCTVWAHERNAWSAMTYDIRDDTIRAFPAGLAKAVVAKLADNPSQCAQVLDLRGQYLGSGAEVVEKDGAPVIDTLQVHDIVARNTFAASDEFGSEDGALRASTGLWVRAAYANHSCEPNVEKRFVGDLMVMYALRRIAAGEEIFNCYDNTADWERRNASLERIWGFRCSCALCEVKEAAFRFQASGHST